MNEGKRKWLGVVFEVLCTFCFCFFFRFVIIYMPYFRYIFSDDESVSLSSKRKSLAGRTKNERNGSGNIKRAVEHDGRRFGCSDFFVTSDFMPCLSWISVYSSVSQRTFSWNSWGLSSSSVTSSVSVSFSFFTSFHKKLPSYSHSLSKNIRKFNSVEQRFVFSFTFFPW